MQRHHVLAVLAATLCSSGVPANAADWSWDPMKDVDNVLPAEAPNEPRLLQGRQQVREMTQDALPRCIPWRREHAVP